MTDFNGFFLTFGPENYPPAITLDCGIRASSQASQDLCSKLPCCEPAQAAPVRSRRRREIVARLGLVEIVFRLHQNRRAKYCFLMKRYLDTNSLHRPEAEQLAGRLGWSCCSLFGRCGRAYLAPIIARSVKREASHKLSGPLRRALEWWLRLLAQPEHLLSRVVPSDPPRPQPMAIS